MTGNDDSKKPAHKTDSDAGAESDEAQGRPPRDTSGEMIAVEVEPPSDAEPDPDAPAGVEADSKEPEPKEPEPEPDPVAELQEQLDKKQKQLLQVAADFDNYKKRSRRDAKEAAFRARNELLQELLPLIDNVELALTHAAEGTEGESDVDSLRKGVEMVLRQFRTTMEKHEVKAFDSLGEPFDPNFHEALQQRETDEYAPGVVMEEFRRGYLMGDRLIRPAMVVVAVAPADTKTSDEGDEDDEDNNIDAEKGDKG